MLRYYAVLKDDALSDIEKVELGVWLFTRNRLRIKKMTLNQKVDLLEAIFQQHIGMGTHSDLPRSIDFDQDSQYIYAAFYQCYQIDLLGKDKNLHWKKFLNLLSGLSDDTRIMQIISIRTRPMPKATKYNAEERANLAKQKARYRIELTDQERQQQLKNGFSKIAQMLEERAEWKK